MNHLKRISTRICVHQTARTQSRNELLMNARLLFNNNNNNTSTNLMRLTNRMNPFEMVVRNLSTDGDGSSSSSAPPPPSKVNDWTCDKCQKVNEPWRAVCSGCETSKPGVYAKPGDFICIECGESNFASRSSCRSCGAPRPAAAGPAIERRSMNYQDRSFAPQRQNSGTPFQPRVPVGDPTKDWKCPNCGNRVFHPRTVCFRRDCATEMPQNPEYFTSERPPMVDRPPRRDFDDRPPRRDFGDRPPRRDYDDRPPRRDFGDRPPRRDFGDRPPRRDFGDRPPRRDYDDRPPRRAPFEANSPDAFPREQRSNSVAPDGGWQCPSCLTKNNLDRTNCRMCGSNKP